MEASVGQVYQESQLKECWWTLKGPQQKLPSQQGSQPKTMISPSYPIVAEALFPKQDWF